MPDPTRRQWLKALPALGLAPRVLAQARSIRVRTLNHFGILVSDPKRSVDFYQSLFGMPVVSRNDGQTILRIGVGPQFMSIGRVEANQSPRITHYGLGVEGFRADRVLAELARHGVAKVSSVGTDKAAVSFSDPDGIEVRLQDVTCGGATAAPSPKKGLIAPKDINHLTIFVTDAARANKFHQDLFGFSIRSYQGPKAPTLAVGPAVQFLMFAGVGAPPKIDHACLTMDAFQPDAVIKSLESFGFKPRESPQGPVAPLRHFITMRMPNRGGAREGTPELYLTDPDGIRLQLQDTTYCGGTGFLGDVCGK